MALTINTNISSLTAQRNLHKTTNGMSRSLERLSSGLRINSARDDAAGLAISDRMTSQVRGLNQAVRNASDGISVAQTAEGALQEMTNVLQRIRELSVQSVNTTNNSTDRDSLNQEVEQLTAEFDRIASQTEFNGIKVLTGNFSGQFQIGSEVGQSIGLTIDDVRADKVKIGSDNAAVEAIVASDTAANTLLFADKMYDLNKIGFSSDKINGVTLQDLTTTEVNNNSKVKVDAINAISSQSGVTAFSIGNSYVVGGSATPALAEQLNAGDLVINGVSIDASGAATGAAMLTAVNLNSAQTGVSMTVSTVGNADLADKYVFTNSTGAEIKIEANTEALQANLFSDNTVGDVSDNSRTIAAGQNGAIVLTNDDGQIITFTSTAGTADTILGNAITGDSTSSYQMAEVTVADMNVSTVGAANMAMVQADDALLTIDNLRSKMGAIQNRLQSTISNLMNVSENISSARSRIMDADIAQETSTMTKNSILQQAGTAILAQANQQPQLALQLLG